MSNSEYKTVNYRNFLWLIIAVYLYSCSPKPITVNYFPNKIIAGKDSIATIRWSFENADRVKVSGLEGDFSSTDSLSTYLDGPKKYNVVAYRGNVDSLINSCLVLLRDYDISMTDKDKEPKKGIENINKIKNKNIVQQITISPSYSPSEYFIGMINSTLNIMPVKFKVMRTINLPGEKEINVRFVMLDKNGNHIYDLINTQKDEFKVSAENECGNYKIYYDKTELKEENNPRTPDNIDLGIILDNSAVAQNNQIILFYLKEFVSRLYLGDNISFSFFNQAYSSDLGLIPAENAVNEISKLTIPENSGSLNGLYRATLNAINVLKAGENQSKALVIITYFDDNCSISFDINDCAQYALDNNIPVYVIAVGSAVKSYYLKYLTDITGGRLYFQFEDELADISDILTEISLSQRFYYEFKVSKYTSSSECVELTTNISVKDGEYILSDVLNTVLKPYSKYSFPQSICTFDKNSITISNDFNLIFESLAAILKDNPANEIQLIGHTFDEGAIGFGKDLSLRRAEEARKMLINKGANPDKIKIKSEGSGRPNFTFIKSNWQEYYNRRVEVRWLDPSVLPYEIDVEDADSESQAFDLMTLWEKRGQKAYFDRYMNGDMPVYKVKLWGYPTIEAAQLAAKTLNTKYKSKLTVE